MASGGREGHWQARPRFVVSSSATAAPVCFIEEASNSGAGTGAPPLRLYFDFGYFKFNVNYDFDISCK